MRNKSFLNILGALFVFAFVITSCEKEEEKTKTTPDVATFPTKEVADYTAKAQGFLVNDGNAALTERGFVWNTTGAPSLTDSKTIEVTGKAGFEGTLTGLTHYTVYYVRAFATNELGTTYGDVDTFMTSAIKATVTVAAATDVMGYSAKVAGNVSYDGESNVTEKGFVFGITENPTTTATKVSVGNGEGEFASDLTGLKANTTYYVRAYAINGVGTAYSAQVSFKTPEALPLVNVFPANTITKTSAAVGAEVTQSGGSAISKYGFYYNTTGNPTAADSKLEITAGANMNEFSFVDTLKMLDLNTKYYVVAFATNNFGTGMSAVSEFTTLANIVKWYVPGGYQGWAPDKAPYIMNTIDDPNNLEGYVNMPVADGFKFTSEPDWAHTNYGVGAPGFLSTTGDNLSVSEAGYYKLNVNPITLAYSVVKVQWGVVGDATPGGWGASTPMAYNTTSGAWEGVFTLTKDGGFKCRANDGWDINFGDTGNNGSAEYGGDNINVTETADYEVSLNLSTPRDYKISWMNWGIIGDATPGGWGTDTNMSYDAASEMWTITTDLKKGELKFRGKDDWAYNYGDDATNGSLEPGGANIPVAEAGNYTVKFSKKNLTYTITKN